MTKVKNGDAVKVHYTGRLKDGTTFDSSEGRDPLEFTVGQGMVIPGFDKAMIDMEAGEKKVVEIPVEEAYGPQNKDMILEFPKTDFPPEMNPEVGMQLFLSDEEGNNHPVVVIEVKDASVVLDANFPLAGKDLIFDIELVAIS